MRSQYGAGRPFVNKIARKSKRPHENIVKQPLSDYNPHPLRKTVRNGT